MDYAEVSWFLGRARVKNPYEWRGFLRSTVPIDNQRRHNAKCMKCGIIIIGTTANIARHRSKCQPQDDQNTAEAEQVQPPTDTPRIDTIFTPLTAAQEQLDEVLTKSFVTGDVPFRYEFPT